MKITTYHPGSQQQTTTNAFIGQYSEEFGNTLPEGWRWVTIGGVVQVNPAKPPKNIVAPDDPVTFIPMPAVDSESGAILYPQNRAFKDVRKGYTAFAENDIIFAKITPCMENGKVAIARNLTNGLGFGSTEFHVLRSTGAVIPEYLYYFLRQESFRREAEHEMTGSVGQRRVPADFIADAPIPLPPLGEQNRIVAKVEELLAQVNAVRERLAKASTILKRFRQTILAAACSGRLTADWRKKHNELELPVLEPEETEIPDALQDLQEIKPQSWALASVSQIANSIQYGYTASAKQKSIGPKFLRITDIQNGRVTWDAVPYCVIPNDQIPRFLLTPGDIVFARTGATTGKSFLIQSCPKAVFASYLIRVQPSSVVAPAFLYIFFQSDFYWKQIAENISGSAQPNCNATKLSSLILPVPPIPEQHEIDRRVDTLFKLADMIEKRVAAATVRSEKLTQAILAKAFRGELVLTEAELARREGRSYEPASELLARIKSEGERNRKPEGRRWTSRKS